MAKRYYSSDDVRSTLKDQLNFYSQKQIADFCGMKPQHLSLAVNGAPIPIRLLTWLGYAQTENLYRKIRKATVKP